MLTVHPNHCSILQQALEYRDYTVEGLRSEGMPSRLAADIVLLALVVAYCFFSMKDILHSMRVSPPFISYQEKRFDKQSNKLVSTPNANERQ